jgi:Stage II sporulation protein E (SpoIIE)
VRPRAGLVAGVLVPVATGAVAVGAVAVALGVTLLLTHIAPVPASGDLLAVWPDIRLHEVELSLQRGASLVFYTDGVTAQGPGVQRSPERAIRTLHGDRSADALADALRDEARRWTDAPRDDVAIVALRYLPAQAPGLTVGPAAA